MRVCILYKLAKKNTLSHFRTGEIALTARPSRTYNILTVTCTKKKFTLLHVNTHVNRTNLGPSRLYHGPRYNNTTSESSVDLHRANSLRRC
jgi:hypothetical protein